MIKKIPEAIKNLNLTKFTLKTEPELNIIACAIGTVQCTQHFTKIGKSSLSVLFEMVENIPVSEICRSRK